MAEKQEKANAPYSQPKVFVGEYVYWSHHKGNERLLGLVTSVATNCVNLLLTADGQSTHRTVRGARHVSDPALQVMVEAPGGVWEHTELGVKTHALLD